MLLVFPPVAKPCEPPAGIAKLAAALRAGGVACTVLDANVEGMLHLLHAPSAASDVWSRRAFRNRDANLAALRDRRTYRSPARYGRAVSDVNRLLSLAGRERDAGPPSGAPT
jgi:hypothetical protein